MSENHFVGRDDAIKRLHEVISGQLTSSDRVTIQSVEGPGGIGKSFLFNHALSTADLTSRNYITLRLDVMNKIINGIEYDTEKAHEIASWDNNRMSGGFDRLLLIVDDFEMLQEPLGEFLVGHFRQFILLSSFGKNASISVSEKVRSSHFWSAICAFLYALKLVFGAPP